MKLLSLLRWLATLLAMLFATSASAVVVTGSLGSHDPSRMIFCNGKYYIYSTGGSMKSSSDRVNWTSGTSPFSTFSGSRPPSMKAVVPTDQGIWAPDIIFYNGKYLLYYSCAGSDGNSSAIGLVTSPTLDPAASGYKWTDAGIVIHVPNEKAVKQSGIDPAPFLDADNNLWLAWGSGYANGAAWTDPTIFLSRLDNSSGLASATDPTRYPTALGHIEAGYVHYRNGFYYLFWNDGGCCSGASSTYKIHLARSANVTGPYVDKNGTNGNVTFFSTNTAAQMYGPGHMGILSEPGIDRFTFHYYPASGGSLIGQRSIVWGADGWPTAGADLVPGTYRITSAATNQAIGVRDAVSTDGAPLEAQTYTGNSYQRWTVSQSTSSGTTLDGFYRITSVASGKVFDLYQSNTADGTLVGQWALGTGNNQRWLIELTTDGKYRIESRTSHDVAALPDSSQMPATQIAPSNGGADVQLNFASLLGWRYELFTS